MRHRRRGGWHLPPGADNASWRLLWVIGGAATFTVIMFFLDLI